MPVTIESRLRRIQVFNLPHDAFCRNGRCACSDMTVVVIDENPRTGERAPRNLQKKVPSSLTLLALERRAGLPSALADVPDVRAAIARGHVRVVEQTPDAAPAANAAPAAVAATPAQPPKGE